MNSFEFESNENFVLCGRKKFIFDEITEILSGDKNVDNPIYFVLGSLEEFICNNNFANISDDNRELIDKYNEIGIICAEEKEYIDKIILSIKDFFLNKKENLIDNFSQEELKNLYYKPMNNSEMSKLNDLKLDREIQYILKHTNNYQIKYINSIGYVFISEGYLIMEDGTEPTHYFVKIFDTIETAKKEILKEYFNKKEELALNIIYKEFEKLSGDNEITILELLSNQLDRYDDTSLVRIATKFFEKHKDSIEFTNKAAEKVGLIYTIPFKKRIII